MLVLKFNKSMCFINRCLFCVVLFLRGLECQADLPPEIQQLCMDNDIKCLSNTLSIRGDYFKALLVAYNQDISLLLKQKKKHALTDAGRFASTLENNDFSIKMDDHNYVVQFGPTLRNKNYMIVGGFVRYIIDGKTFKILKIVRLR